MSDDSAFAERVQGRLDRLDVTPADADRTAGLPSGTVGKVLDGRLPLLRGKRLVKLAEALATSVSYLVGLDPDVPVPDEYLTEEQGSLGLLASDENTLLHAYRRLDVASRSALLHVLIRMAPEPEVYERKARQASKGPPRGLAG